MVDVELFYVLHANISHANQDAWLSWENKKCGHYDKL